MKTGLYVIWDDVAQESGPIYQAKNHDVALRMYQQTIQRNELNEHDFVLFHVGNYDSEALKIDPIAESYIVKAKLPKEEIDE